MIATNQKPTRSSVVIHSRSHRKQIPAARKQLRITSSSYGVQFDGRFRFSDTSFSSCSLMEGNVMCGRITSKVSPQDLQEFFDVVRFADSIDWAPRYNVAPTTQMICVKSAPDGREAFPARWGLIPSWAKDLKIAASTFNARSDTVATKPMFRSAFKARRCLVIASGLSCALTPEFVSVLASAQTSPIHGLSK